MILQSESSKSRWCFVSWFSVLGGPTAHTCARGFTDTCDSADSSNSSNIYRQLLTSRATIPASYQCGLNVFPVSSSVFRRERIRGHPSAQAAYVGSSLAHSSCVTVTLVASVSATSSIVARDGLSFWPIAKVY